MLLNGKNAIIYGGGGAIGGAVARTFADEGARVHLVGRTQASLDRVCAKVRAAGGNAETAQLDALDEAAVDQHAETVAANYGSVDISFNLISHGDVQGTPLAEMSVADLLQPVVIATKAVFISSRAAARRMIKQKSGVILMFGGYGDPMPGYHLGGLQVAFGAVESLRRNLACELGPHGIRVVTLQTAGVLDTIPESVSWRSDIEDMTRERSMTNSFAHMEDVGNVAAFIASDKARTMSATAFNMTCATIVD